MLHTINEIEQIEIAPENKKLESTLEEKMKTFLESFIVSIEPDQPEHQKLLKVKERAFPNGEVYGVDITTIDKKAEIMVLKSRAHRGVMTIATKKYCRVTINRFQYDITY